MYLFSRLANVARVAKLALEALQTSKRIVGQPSSREINTSGRIFGRRGIMSAGGARTVIFWDRLDTGQGQKPIGRCIAYYRDSIIPPIIRHGTGDS